MSPSQEKVILPTTSNLNISTKFKITVKWKPSQVKRWIDTAGEIQILYIVLKWVLVVCFHAIRVRFFARYQIIAMSINTVS